MHPPGHPDEPRGGNLGARSGVVIGPTRRRPARPAATSATATSSAQPHGPRTRRRSATPAGGTGDLDGRPVVPAAGRDVDASRATASRARRAPRPAPTRPARRSARRGRRPVRSTSRNSTQPVRRPRVTSRASPASRVRSANVTSSRSSWSIARTHASSVRGGDGLAVDVDLDHERAGPPTTVPRAARTARARRRTGPRVTSQTANASAGTSRSTTAVCAGSSRTRRCATSRRCGTGSRCSGAAA